MPPNMVAPPSVRVMPRARLILLLLCALAALLPFTAHADLGLGLVGYWSFNEGTGDIATDFSGNGNHGFLTGGAWTNGKRGKAIDFSGDGIDAGDTSSLTITGQFSIAAWIRYREVGAGVNHKTIVEKYSVTDTGYGMFLGTTVDQNLHCDINTEANGVVSNTVFEPNVWYHVVCVKEASQMRVYVNGVLDNTDGGATNPSSSAGGSFLIAEADAFTFTGIVDEVRVYNRALSASEIAELYRLGAVLHKPANNLGLVGYWSFNEGTSTIARDLNIPVAHTLTGKGAIPCTDPLSAGLFGRYDRIANSLIEASDLILVIGCKLGEIATKRYTVPNSAKRVVHLDILPEEFGRTIQPELVLWSDATLGIQDLQTTLADRATEISAHQRNYAIEVPQRMAEWLHGVSERLNSDETPISMARLMTEINQVLPEDGFLVADGGFAAHWGGLLFDTKKAGRRFVPDRGFASIGYGLPGAIGVALAAPGRAVLSLTGDGGFNMMLGELETARRLNLNLTIVVVNNAASGYVKALQHLVYGKGAYHASDLAETNYADVARALGCKGVRVEEPGALSGALRNALSDTGPIVLDVVVTRDPAKMLPGVDNRTIKIKKGDRVA